MPQKKLEEVPKEQMKDLKQEETARSRSEEEQAKCAFRNSHRHMSKDNGWMNRYKLSRSEIHVESFQDEQSSLNRVLEVELRVQYRG